MHNLATIASPGILPCPQGWCCRVGGCYGLALKHFLQALVLELLFPAAGGAVLRSYITFVVVAPSQQK